jgi:DNA-directed RNA polymerase specialized sigma24 family protein
LRLVYQYRYRHRDGNYVLLHDEKAVFRASDDRYLFYSLFRDVTEEVIFGGVKVEAYKQGAALKKITEYKPSSALQLSKREAEVFALIKKGLTTKEIGAQLGISHHTVRNFRSKLFGKYKVNKGCWLKSGDQRWNVLMCFG